MTPIARLFAAAMLAAIAGPVALPAAAAEFEVRMLNRGEQGNMVFEPAFLRIEPGDTVRFVPTDRSHNAETIAEAIPDGAATFRSRINEEFTVDLTVPGLYAIKCTPHLSMGMVMVVQVGEDTHNLDALQTVRVPRGARTRLDAALAQID